MGYTDLFLLLPHITPSNVYLHTLAYCYTIYIMLTFGYRNSPLSGGFPNYRDKESIIAYIPGVIE